MRESSFEMQITNLNKEKAALKSQLDQTLDELMQVRHFSYSYHTDQLECLPTMLNIHGSRDTSMQGFDARSLST